METYLYILLVSLLTSVSSKALSFSFLRAFILILFFFCWSEVIFKFFSRKDICIDFLKNCKYLKMTLLFLYEVEFGWV